MSIDVLHPNFGVLKTAVVVRINLLTVDVLRHSAKRMMRVGMWSSAKQYFIVIDQLLKHTAVQSPGRNLHAAIVRNLFNIARCSIKQTEFGGAGRTLTEAHDILQRFEPNSSLGLILGVELEQLVVSLKSARASLLA